MRPLAAVLAALALHAQPRAFTPADLLEWRQIDSPRIHAEGGLVVFAETAVARETDSIDSRIRIVSTGGKNLRTITEGHSPRWSPDGTRLAFLSDRTAALQIFIRKVDAASDQQLTRLDSQPLDLAWSPDGTALAFTARVTESASGVAWAPIALQPQLRVSRTRLFIVNTAGGEPRALPLGNLDALGEPSWMPDGRSLLFAAAPPLDPDQPLVGPAIYALRLADSTLRRLTTGSGSHTDPIVSPDGSRISWIARESVAQSYVTGKLWVAGADGSRARALAGALDRDPRHPQWSSDSRTVYFLADDRGATHVYAARNDGAARQVANVRGRLHDFSLADNGRAVSVGSTEELIVFPVDSPGEPVRIAAPNESWLAQRSIGTVEELPSVTANRTPQAWMTRPPAFDAGKKYALLLDFDDAPRRMCGGEFRLRAQVFAAAGFVVLCVNPRGTPGYGETYGNLLHTRLPGDDFDGLMLAVDAAVATGYIDPTRLHMVGGLLAAWAIGHTDRFRSVVARRVVADWALDIATAPDGPRRAAAWLGAFPWTNAEQYTTRSPIYAAASFKTPTLVIAGENDPAAAELHFALRMRKVESHLVRIGAKPSQAVLEMDATLAWLRK